jgi:hypothetical protein
MSWGAWTEVRRRLGCLPGRGRPVSAAGGSARDVAAVLDAILHAAEQLG